MKTVSNDDNSFKAVLASETGLDADELLRRLDDAVQPAYQEWSRKMEEIELPGDFGHLANPPRDITSFLLDEVLPDALSRPKSSHPVWFAELRSLARELEPKHYIMLIIAYAEQRKDREGVRRAFLERTAPGSPYLTMFKRFRDQSAGGQRAAGAESPEKRKRAERNEKIINEAARLRQEGKERSVASFLARKHKLSAHTVRNILKKAEGL